MRQHIELLHLDICGLITNTFVNASHSFSGIFSVSARSNLKKSVNTYGFLCIFILVSLSFYSNIVNPFCIYSITDMADMGENLGCFAKELSEYWKTLCI